MRTLSFAAAHLCGLSRASLPYHNQNLMLCNCSQQPMLPIPVLVHGEVLALCLHSELESNCRFCFLSRGLAWG